MIQTMQFPTGKLPTILMKYVNDYQIVEQLVELWEEVYIEKGRYLLKENVTCDHLYFLETGALKKFYFSDKGEHVTCISLEMSFVTAFHSFLPKEPSLINIMTIEDCKLKRISRKNWHLMSAKFPILNVCIRRILEQYYCGLERHIINLQKTTAKERFVSLLKDNPSIFNRIKLKDIASYLNMTPATLSRIRSSQIA